MAASGVISRPLPAPSGTLYVHYLLLDAIRRWVITRPALRRCMFVPFSVHTGDAKQVCRDMCERKRGTATTLPALSLRITTSH